MDAILHIIWHDILLEFMTLTVWKIILIAYTAIDVNWIAFPYPFNLI